MIIKYNRDGLPYILDGDSIIEFDRKNSSDIVGEFSIDKDLLDNVFNEIKLSIISIIDEFSLDEVNDFKELFKEMSNIVKVTSLMQAVDILSSAEDLYYEITTQSPYDSWRWNNILRRWEPPFNPPAGDIDEIYKWDDETATWLPKENAPSNNYIWSNTKHEWIPKVSYPIDAAPGEFIWDNDSNMWKIVENQ